MTDRIKLGISSCLLGESVRYDGGHKLDRYLKDVLGPFVDWVPVCPEVECGLTIPRESMRLVDFDGEHRLMTIKSGIDYTEKMNTWSQTRLSLIEKEQLCGFIFKTKSPSSGMRDVRIYGQNGMVMSKGIGLWAKAFMNRFPDLPVEDEGRLNDPGLRENFIERVFVLHRWQQFINNDSSLKGLVDFHTDHKLLIMAHSTVKLRELGTLVSTAKNPAKEQTFNSYLSLLMKTLQLKATVNKNVNVMHHIMGYFKKQLTGDEKQELLDIIDQYHQGLVPQIVPIVLLAHYTRKFDDAYLKRQIYLSPHPKELLLRNHV